MQESEIVPENQIFIEKTKESLASRSVVSLWVLVVVVIYNESCIFKRLLSSEKTPKPYQGHFKLKKKMLKKK